MGGRWAWTVVVVALTVSACGGDNSSSGSSAATTVAAATVAAGGATEAGGGEAAGAPQEQVATGRSVIYTADLTVRADDVVAATRRAVEIAEGNGGLLFAQQSRLEDHPESTLTLKVPPDKLAPTLDALAGLGHDAEPGD